MKQFKYMRKILNIHSTEFKLSFMTETKCEDILRQQTHHDQKNCWINQIFVWLSTG